MLHHFVILQFLPNLTIKVILFLQLSLFFLSLFFRFVVLPTGLGYNTKTIYRFKSILLGYRRNNELG